MRICVPVLEDQGLESQVSAHFGSAPLFMLVDTEAGSCRAIRNNNAHHGHGMCSPLEALRGERFDSIVVEGIGNGAANRLRAAGIAVLHTNDRTVGEVVAAFRAGTLQPLRPGETCGQHRHGQH
jgi:predicted Fe-Mo cluster-binding NifX family protein